MTQRQANVLKILLPFIGTIFAGGVAWRDLKGDVDNAVPETRFVSESLRTDATLRTLLSNSVDTRDAVKELSARMLEVCVELKGKAGCR